MMDIRTLRYFLAVAREKSISGASDFLHVTQPTLSRQIKELEQELGTQLFIRGSRHITLTESGILLRKRAEEIISLFDKAHGELTNSSEVISGEIYIGSGETDSIRYIAKVAKQLHDQYPMLRYQLYSGNSESVIERLDHGLLDFGILFGSVDTDKYDFIRMPTTDQWGLLMRRDSPLAIKHSLSPKDLWDIPLLFSSTRSFVTEPLLGWIGKNKDDLNIVATYNLIYNAAIMVEEGLGYALCLDKLVNTTGTSHLCFKPFSPPIDLPLYIVWKKYQVFPTASKLFLDTLIKTYSFPPNTGITLAEP